MIIAYSARDIRIDHNDIGDNEDNFRRTGILVFSQPKGNVRIDHNYFHGSPWIKKEYEAIWLAGRDAFGLWDNSGILVERNLFENWDGDDEVISIKTSGVTIRNNTFRNNRWGHVNRFGEGNIIKNNVFDSSQLQIWGASNKVIGNLFTESNNSRLRVRDGNRTYRQMRAEVARKHRTCCGHEQARNTIVYGNRGGVIELGEANGLPPLRTMLGGNTGHLKLKNHVRTTHDFTYSGDVGAPVGVERTDVGPSRNCRK